MNTMRSIDLNLTSPISPKQRNINTMRSIDSNQTSPISPKQRNINTMRSIDLNLTSSISPKQWNMNTMRSIDANQTSPISPKYLFSKRWYFIQLIYFSIFYHCIGSTLWAGWGGTEGYWGGGRQQIIPKYNIHIFGQILIKITSKKRYCFMKSTYFLILLII